MIRIEIRTWHDGRCPTNDREAEGDAHLDLEELTRSEELVRI